jgi:hypothetical protein
VDPRERTAASWPGRHRCSRVNRSVREDAEARVEQARADAEAVRISAAERYAEARADAHAEIARLEAMLDRVAGAKP